MESSAQIPDLEGDQPLEVGDLILLGQERTLPLGPLFGTLIVDLDTALREFEDRMVEELWENGIEVTPTGKHRAQWTGAFTYEVEAEFKVYWFHAAQQKTIEEIKAGWGAIVALALGLAITLAVGWISKQWIDWSRENKQLATKALDVTALAFTAAGLFAVAWIARSFTKGAPAQ